jgi:cation diffusion facilitator family transporter
MTATTDLQRIRDRAGLLSMVIGFVMLGLKMGAYLYTGSAAILSDALESVVHQAATVVMFWCLRIASKMPDEDHPYGHGKVEYLSVGFEGGAILLAAFGVVFEAGRALWSGHAPDDLGIGLVLVAVAAAINVLLGLHLVRTGRKAGSRILIADGQHVLSDVWTSVAVLVGVAMMWVLPLGAAKPWVDAGVAVSIAGFLVYTGGSLMRQALRGLLDEADMHMVEQVVAAVNAIREPEWYDLHNLRLRTSGDLVFIEFHLAVPAHWTIARAHDDMDRIEAHILATLGVRGAVMIHLDHCDLETVQRRIGLSGGVNVPFTVSECTYFHAI